MLRQPKDDDQEQLVRIYELFYENEFPLDLSTAFASVVAEQDGAVLGFGWLDLSVESNIILDLSARPRDKFEALRAIVSHGTQVARNAGMNQIHAFPKDPKFVRILEKHLNFKVVSSSCLVRNLKNG